MPYIGKTPTAVPLTANDITDGIISTDKLADTSVTNAKLNADLISGETELATAPADTDEFLISDAGVLKRIDASLVGGGGITEADMWRTSADQIGSSLNPITSNIERVDNTEGWWDKIGTGMTQSSGVFTFPSTGIWLVRFLASIYNTGASDDTDVTARIDVTPDNGSNYYQAGSSAGRVNASYDTVFTESLIDCNNTSNVKVRFDFDNIGSGTYLR